MNIKKYFANLFSKKSLTGSGLGSLIANSEIGDESDRFKRWVYACITTIAKGIAQTDFILAQNTKTGVKRIENHELLNLLYNFNPKSTKYNSLYLTILYFLKDGEVAWILEMPDGRKKPTAIYVVPTSTLTVAKRDDNNTPTDYRFTVGNKVQNLPANLVKILINPDPNNPQRGMSIISAMQDVVDNDTRMVKWNKSLLGNSAMPSGTIEVTGSLDAGQVKILREQFDSLYSGYSNVGRTAILPNGSKFSPFSIPPKDMEFVEGRKMNRDEILAIFGVPKILLGLENGYNRATAETAERMFAKYTLQPLMTMIIEQLNVYLTPIYDNNLWLDFEDLDTVDREQQLNEQNLGFNRWLTTNEIREQNGLSPVRGGDMIYLPFNLVPSVGGDVPASKAMKILKVELEKKSDFGLKRERKIRGKILARNYILLKNGDDISDRIISKIMNTNKPFKLKIIKKTPIKKISGKKKIEIWEQAENIRSEIEKMFVKKLKQLFENQKNKVLENLDLQKKSLNSEPFDLKDEIQSTINIIEPQYYEALTYGARFASQITGEDYIDITSLPAVREWAIKLSEKYATEITNLTYQTTIDVVQEAVKEGLSTDNLAKNISELFDGMSENRSQVIARTESARALTAGQAHEWKEAGVKKFEWLTSGDSSVSAICQYNSTLEWSAKDAEQGTVEHSHPNCRCVFLPL